ncbi:MAG: hypothetical protein E7513_07525 [Ruminococcaceae bacterium]|nr:hypothetical protein [Oscillospiraceae bacterium]
MFERKLCVKLQRKLYFVYILNVLDWVCTILLISSGLFYEANPIANTFISSIGLGLLIKCIVPFALVFTVCRFMHILDFSQLKVADMVISFGLTFYLFITLDHIINFIILLQS